VDGIIDNSPLSVSKSMFKGKYLRFFSSNGASALASLISAHFQSIHALSFANIDATVRSVLAKRPERVWVTCGGFYGSSSLEDSVAAGLAIQGLIDAGFAGADDIDDEAEAMRIQAIHFRNNTQIDAERLVSTLDSKQVSRLITPFGHKQDIRACVRGDGLEHGLWNAMISVSLVASAQCNSLLVPEQTS
jgi:phosphosulfolactate phosphohydrolase-like enzyme